MSNANRVIVVGAGPAGASSTIAALKAGVEVTIVDRKTNVGIPVQCGEAIGKTGPNIAKIDIPQVSIRVPIRGFRVYSPSLIPVDFSEKEPSGFIIDRRVFDKELFTQATEAGADANLPTLNLNISPKATTFIRP